MELFNLGRVPWADSQLIYHALARLGRPALSLVSPASPYVCLGFHQDARHEVDLDFCENQGLPVFRREVGGGAVFLDGNQLFFQLVLPQDHPEITPNRESFYRKFLDPVVRVYRRLGIAALFRPINDVVVENRKISGTGVGEIGDCVVLVGNLILDFDYRTMARVLRVPDEKFRDKVHKTIQENLSTIRRELGEERAAEWSEAGLNALLAEEFGRILGPLVPAQADAALRAEMDRLKSWMLTPEWLLRKGRRYDRRQIKIRAGLHVVHKVHKAPGGLIRAVFDLDEGRIRNLELSGDFFAYPPEALAGLEAALEGTTPAEAEEKLQAFYRSGRVETPGVKVSDWL
ncbi:MAG: lipoate protein ligase C-terminal domain-containing protein, partial [Thermodesulfobacteriota bacterium]